MMIDSADKDQDGPSPELHETSERIIAQIQAEDVILPMVPFHLVEKHHNKTTKLLANSGSQVIIDSRNRWHDFEFTKPIFVSLARVTTTGFSNHHDFRVKVKLVDGGSKEFTAKFDSDHFAVYINEYVNEISFQPPSIWFKNPTINEVTIWGFYKDDVSVFLRHFANIERVKGEAIAQIRADLEIVETAKAHLTARETELATVESDIASNQLALEALESELAKETQRLGDLQTQTSTITSQIQNLSDQVDEKKAEIGTLTTGREDLKIEIDRANLDLRKLKENINLFPSEISGFVTQAAKDVRLYMFFAGILICVICALSFWVLNGALDLSEYVKKYPDTNVGKLLAAKIPSAFGVAALVGACYKISRVFIEELLKINRQKLSLTQVSIIAKDVSFAAESDLSFGETEIYALRLRTKMAMLGDHIKTFVPSDPGSLFPTNLFDVFQSSSRRQERATAPKQSSPSAPESSEEVADSED